MLPVSFVLLMALGLKGGHALAQTGVDGQVLASIGLALVMAVLVPALGYQFLKRRVSGFDAAAVAASYGSVSAVTFVTALQVLESQGLSAPGHMTVAMVLMETPAIVMAVVLASPLRQAAGTAGAGPVVIVSADALASHQSVINVMDAARRVGLNQLTFATQAGRAPGARRSRVRRGGCGARGPDATRWCTRRSASSSPPRRHRRAHSRRRSRSRATAPGCATPLPTAA